MQVVRRNYGEFWKERRGGWRVEGGGVSEAMMNDGCDVSPKVLNVNVVQASRLAN